MVKNIDKKEVIKYFNSLAPAWDEEMITDDAIIAKALDAAGIEQGCDVLDIACGTGVLFPYYLERKVSLITGVDISSEMINAARKKFAGFRNITLLCEDAEEFSYGRLFDAVVVYNAFPHFANPERLIENLSSLTKSRGTLTIVHGMSRERINTHHSGSAMAVSRELMPAEELASLFPNDFKNLRIISDDTMYLVSGRREP